MAGTMGERVHERREALGFSVNNLALRLGVSDRAMRLIESGQTRNVGHYTFLKLARILNLDPYHLAFGDANFQWEDVPRLPEEAVQALERLSARTDALDQRVSNLESQVAGVLKRIAPE